MKSLKKVLLKRKYKVVNDYKDDVLLKYLKRKLIRKYKSNKGEEYYDRRPKELKYLHIAKATGLTYKQVRTRIDKLVESGIIEKYRAWSDLNCSKNYYRFSNPYKLHN